MRLTVLAGILLAFFASLAYSIADEQKIDILVWPLSAPKPQPLAKISYNTTGAILNSYTPPKLPTPTDEIVRIGFYSPEDSTAWSGILTSATNFDSRKEKRLQLLLNAHGKVYHVGFRAVDTLAKKSPDEKDDVTVEVVRMRDGPTPRLNKPVVVRPDGNADGQEPEKTFLQKYWWAIGGILLIQVLMASGGKQE